MKSFNECILEGYIGAEVTIKNGRVSVPLAVKEDYKKDEDYIAVTEWHYLTLFGKKAESFANAVNKGDKVFVTGRYRCSQYEKNNERSRNCELHVSQFRVFSKEMSLEDMVEL